MLTCDSHTEPIAQNKGSFVLARSERIFTGSEAKKLVSERAHVLEKSYERASWISGLLCGSKQPTFKDDVHLGYKQDSPNTFWKLVTPLNNFYPFHYRSRDMAH